MSAAGRARRAVCAAVVAWASAAAADPDDRMEFGHRFDAEFRGCYARAQRFEASLSTRVELRFTVDRDGHTRDIHASLSAPSPMLQRCLEGVLRRARFARRARPVTVVMPIAHDRP